MMSSRHGCRCLSGLRVDYFFFDAGLSQLPWDLLCLHLRRYDFNYDYDYQTH